LDSSARTGCRLGVLAFGDSITNGGGELQWGVALQSWAQWVARGLGLPFTNYAVDGQRVADVLGHQIPAFRERTPHPDGRYELGCLYIGVNDARALDWDPPAFERDYRTALTFLADRCDRVLAVNAPLDLGRPRAGHRVAELNTAIARAAGDHEALLVDLSAIRARNLVMPDHVHLTAFGQIALAERALHLLERDGARVAVRPKSLIYFETTARGRLQGDLTYVYRHAKITGLALYFHALALRHRLRTRAAAPN
jgi:lysophospholipase L1-like esterase